MLTTDTSSITPATTETADPVPSAYLHIADFAAGLSLRLLAETRVDGSGPDDEFLRGYARAASDLAEALLAGDLLPGGPYCSPADA